MAPKVLAWSLMNPSGHNHASLTSAAGEAEIVRRIVYLGYLGCVVLATVLCFIGICLENGSAILGAFAAGMALLGLRHWLIGHPAAVEEGEAEEEDWVWETPERSTASRPRVGELANLLQEMDSLEKARGSGRFDPWALRSVRHEIRSLMEADPRLKDTLGL